MDLLTNASRHDTDFHAWAEEQAALLRSGRVADIDADHVADEIEQLGRQLQREVEDRLAILLLHLIRWDYEGGLRGKAWKLTIMVQRNLLARLLRESPGLLAFMDDVLQTAHDVAASRAELETGWPRDCFPWVCKWSLQQVLDHSFLPESE